MTRRTAFYVSVAAACAVIALLALGFNPPDSKPQAPAIAVVPPTTLVIDSRTDRSPRLKMPL